MSRITNAIRSFFKNILAAYRNPSVLRTSLNALNVILLALYINHNGKRITGTFNLNRNYDALANAQRRWKNDEPITAVENSALNRNTVALGISIVARIATLFIR